MAGAVADVDPSPGWFGLADVTSRTGFSGVLVFCMPKNLAADRSRSGSSPEVYVSGFDIADFEDCVI